MSSEEVTMELSGEARFELKRQLADTLQGRIYSAIDKNTGEWVVVKETWKQLVKLGKSRDGHSVPEDFESEKRILKYLSSQKDAHLGFVRLIDEWEDNDCFLYAMEMCRGGELFEFIKGMHSDGAVAHYTRQQSRLKQECMTTTNEWIKVVQRMFKQIVSCTSWLHSKGVCHLDMSLENAMIASRSKKHGNQIKIIDFGLSRYYSSGNFTNNKRVGKTGYMSPEVFARKKYDPRAADIWSLGVMLFMMLIGAPPYQIPSPSNPAFKFIVNGRLKDVLKHWKRLRCINKEALDLLNKIFKYENKRITMDEILKHPFVNLSNNNNNTASQSDTIKEQKKVIQQEPKPKVLEPVEPQSQPSQVISQVISQPQEEDKQQQQAPPQPQEEQEQEPEQEANNYAYKSETCKKFSKQLTSNLQRDELIDIMRNIEQQHNGLQSKLNQQNQNNSSNSGSKIDSKQQQQLKELDHIYKVVLNRLESYPNSNNNNNNLELNNMEQQQQHQATKPKVERHTPHNN
mmetsp:Transcript_50876/g.45662  ORF Transcript_50876/g.45662 Transcript_50876/m.45662 type:complete len:514 (-) Transcript_50876:102-1643(-)